MKPAAYTYGNLALEIEPSFEPAWQVIPGNADARHSAVLQVAAPDAYARTCAGMAATPRTIALCVAAICLLVFACGVASFYVNARASSQDAVTDSLATQVVTVESGDSLWSLARHHEVDGLTVGEEVELIRSMNGLSSATLQPGMKLTVPLSRH